MSTYLVLMPFAPGQRLAVTPEDNFQIFEVDENLVIPIKNRPNMPGIHEWMSCHNKEQAIELAEGGQLPCHSK